MKVSTLQPDRIAHFFVIALFLMLVPFSSEGAEAAATSGQSKDGEPLTFKQIEQRFGQASPQELLIAAKGGDAVAQSLLGFRLEQGKELKQDLAEAAEWYRKAAEQGVAFAQFSLGWMYEAGKGVQKSRDFAMDWTRKAADQGFTPAEVNLGWFYANEKVKPGEVITGNYPVAAEWYEKAAKKGHANAQFLLGELYLYRKLGDPVRTNCARWFLLASEQGHLRAQAALGNLANYEEYRQIIPSTQAVALLHRAAERGDLEAQYTLARRFRTGDGVGTNLVQAFEWMKRAAGNETRGSRITDASYELAWMYEKGEGTARNAMESRALFQFAADNGHPDAQYEVAHRYEVGEGVPQDYQRATHYYFQAATRGWGSHQVEAAERVLAMYDAGRGLPTASDEIKKQLKRLEYTASARSQLHLGKIYRQGKIVAEDTAIAVGHFTRAAQMGSGEAQNTIGEMWAAGLQGQPDPTEAAVWYRKAADRGWAEAQFNLGRCYAKGEGVSMNPVEAWQWLSLAENQNFSQARPERARLEEGMTPSQLVEARERAAKFKPSAALPTSPK